MGVKFPASSTMEFQMLNYRSFAQVILVGVLGHNAQVRQTKSGSAMLTFSVATKSSVKQATGGYQTVTTWHDCLMFGPRGSVRISVSGEVIPGAAQRGCPLYLRCSMPDLMR